MEVGGTDGKLAMPLFRNTIASRLKEDLSWPSNRDTKFSADRPTQRYSTGILYPLHSRIEPEEDQDHDLVVNVVEDTASEPGHSQRSLSTRLLKPSVAGLSFAVKPEKGEDWLPQ